MALRVVKEQSASRCVASRDLLSGDVVALEEPLVSTRSELAAHIDAKEVEWTLVNALLTRGKREEWARQFCLACESAAATAAAGSSVPQLLSAMHQVPIETVLLMYRVVCANAFGLETPLLEIEYGAAFYETCCRLNHDCNPNCLSIRLGGDCLARD